MAAGVVYCLYLRPGCSWGGGASFACACLSAWPLLSLPSTRSLCWRAVCGSVGLGCFASCLFWLVMLPWSTCVGRVGPWVARVGCSAWGRCRGLSLSSVACWPRVSSVLVFVAVCGVRSCSSLCFVPFCSLCSFFRCSVGGRAPLSVPNYPPTLFSGNRSLAIPACLRCRSISSSLDY